MRRAPKNPRQPGESCEKRGHCWHDVNGDGIRVSVSDVRCCWCGETRKDFQGTRYAWLPGYYAHGQHGTFSGPAT